jgi:hypothetical protein
MTPQPTLDPQTQAPTPQPRKATGPTTPEGKNHPRLNALRHGLAGQTVLMPWEDREAYQAHCAAIIQELAPFGQLETQCAQGIADDQWRLNRARAVDTNMFALGQFDYAPLTGDQQADAALNAARAFRDHSKAFGNLSLYEQRISRSLEKNFARLQTLQQERELKEGVARADKIRQQVIDDHAAGRGPAPSKLTLAISPAAKDPVARALAAAQEFVYSTREKSAAAPAANSGLSPEPAAKIPPASVRTAA